MRVLHTLLAVVWLLAAWAPSALGADLGPLLETLRAVGPKGAGNREAGRAWQKLSRAEAAQLPTILAGLDGAGPLAANWIRTAADAIAERELARGGTLPAAELEKFLLDTRHSPRGRRLAYEWLCQLDATVPERLLPGMLNDPSAEIRRDAIARLIDQADELGKAGQSERALPVYEEALLAARDVDQINLLAGRLRKSGREVDLPRHFGFLLRWQVIGPFDNTDGKGFDSEYPPEREIDLGASYQGKHAAVRWIEQVSKDDYGQVDLNQALGEEKAVVAYATTEFVSPERTTVEFRLASCNAVKLWVGGVLVDQHEVYHAGSQMDQYVSRVELKPGRNVILVKVCQNALNQEWARFWSFQLRVCDGNGTAILSADR
jgi:hypothetical protein